MGLAERRALEEFQTNILPGLQSRIDEAAGMPVSLDIHWDSLAREGEARLYAESWPLVYFEPLIGALESITRDAMGKQALAGALKSVVIQDTRGNYYADNWASFADGVLTLDHEPFTNAQDVADRTRRLIGVLESAL